MSLNSKQLLSLLLCTMLLAGCNSGDDDNACLSSTTNAALISTTAADYSDSNVELVDMNQAVLTAREGCYKTGLSDYDIAAYNGFFYRIGRQSIDTVSKHPITAPDTTRYTYSTIDAPNDPTANPYDLIFVNSQKAYLTRYGSNKIWIVNPSAILESNFKIGEIDMSAYNDVDGMPEISHGIIIGDKFYVLMERLENWSIVDGNAYIAVIDTNTDTEIDTDTTDAPTNLKGINLQINNPQNIVYNASAGLFVQGDDKYGGSYVGGIETIDTGDYSTNLLVDDNTTTVIISDIAIINNTLGYVVIYNGWQDTTLYRFDPSNGDIATTAVANMENIAISSLSVDESGKLWVSIADNGDPRIEILDPAMSDTVTDTIKTVYNPDKVVFTSL